MVELIKGDTGCYNLKMKDFFQKMIHSSVYLSIFGDNHMKYFK